MHALLPELLLLLTTLTPLTLSAAAPRPDNTFDSTASTFQPLPSSTSTTSSGTAALNSLATSATASLLSGTSTGSPAASSTRAYVHFDCGTHIGHASGHFIDTIHGLHTGAYPNGSSYDGASAPAPSSSGAAAPSPSSPAGKGTFGGQYDPHAANGIGKRDNVWPARFAFRRFLARQTNDNTAAAASNPASGGPAPAGKISVNVYMHVVTTAAHAGMVTQAQVTQQVGALNSAYNAHGVSFRLANTSFTANDQWAVGGNDAVDVQMKTALRQGTYADLNLYFQSDMAGGVLGQCTLPTNIGTNPAPSVYVRDGCNIAAGTVPGGPINGYNMGKTAVHETGHWLGLLHTFEGYSCGGNGDFVNDTPAEAQSTDGCPNNPWKNTCAGQRPGNDPIHNYMDYSTDACYSRFSMGQEQRLHSLWPQYRAGK